MEIGWHDVVGHASFGLTALAYSMRRIVMLRIIGLVSLSCGLVYNYFLPTGPLWLVLFWLAVFMLIHLTRVSSEILHSIEAPLTPRQKSLLAGAFPGMHSGDWQALWKCGRVSRVAPHEVLLRVGDATRAVTMLVSGATVEKRPDGRHLRRQPSQIWGELTFVVGEEGFDGSPVEIVAGPEGAEVIAFPYAALRRLFSVNDRMRAAFLDGVVRSAGFKHGLLAMSWEGAAQAPCIEPIRVPGGQGAERGAPALAGHALG
jgi:hypothetical protein